MFFKAIVGKAKDTLQKYVKGHIKECPENVMEQIDKIIQDQKATVDDLAAQIEGFKKDKRILGDEIQTLNSRLKKYDSLHELEKAIALSENNLNQLQGELDLIMKQYESLQIDYKSLDATCNDLASKIKKREQQLHQLSEENLQHLVEKEELEHQLEVAKKRKSSQANLQSQSCQTAGPICTSQITQTSSMGMTSASQFCQTSTISVESQVSQTPIVSFESQFCQTGPMEEASSNAGLLEKYHSSIRINRKLQKELDSLKMLYDDSSKENMEPTKKRKVSPEPESIVKTPIMPPSLQESKTEEETDANCSQQ